MSGDAPCAAAGSLGRSSWGLRGCSRKKMKLGVAFSSNSDEVDGVRVVHHVADDIL